MESLRGRLVIFVARARGRAAARFPVLKPLWMKRLHVKVGRHANALSHAAAARGADRGRLLHLLGCRACRRQAAASLSRQLAGRLDEWLAPPPRREGTQRLPADLAGLADLAWEINSRPAEERPHAVQAMVAESSMSALEWAAALIAAARQAVGDPPRAAAAAELALELVTGQAAMTFDEALPVRLDALALLVLLRHRLGRLDDAEEAHQQALPLLAAAAPLSHQRAILVAALGQLRWTQGRLDEAAACFALGQSIFMGVGEHEAAISCQLLAGFVSLAQGNAERARVDLEMGVLDIDPALSPALAARAAFALACCYAALGRAEEAIGALESAHLSDPAPDADEAAQRRWLEGRTLAAIGRCAEAEAHVDAARRTLLARGTLGEAAGCTLDLFVVRERAGRPAGLTDLGAELLAAFVDPTPELVRFAESLDSLAALAAKGSPLVPITFRAVRRAVAELPAAAGRRELASVQEMADRVLVTPVQELLEELPPEDDDGD